jgi:nitrite reductase/ring-hydroxylating ferredoxin subunit
MDSALPSDRWYPIVRIEELPPRHIFHALVRGNELALWRDDAGLVNAWENRCPHRGLRLTIGANLGSELQCRYHGWRFASGSGQCSHIPAQPAEQPPRTIRIARYPCREAFGFAWVSLAAASGVPALAHGAAAPSYTGRSITIAAPLERVRGALIEAGAATTADPLVLRAELDLDGPVGTSLLLLPASGEEIWMHGLIHAAHIGAARPAALHRYARWANALRRRVAAISDANVEEGAC